MRDALDPGTIEMPLQRKRGRPSKFSGGAMSAAERAKRYRDARRIETRVAVTCIVLEAENPVSNAAILDALRKAVAEADARAVTVLTDELRARFPIA